MFEFLLPKAERYSGGAHIISRYLVCVQIFSKETTPAREIKKAQQSVYGFSRMMHRKRYYDHKVFV
jgi:hypothetical protein